MFIDQTKIYLKAGDGGNGAVSFRREKYVAAGGPDGGDGGRGGSVILRVDTGANTLLAFRYKHKFEAKRGGDGSGAKFHGANGEDMVILVPPGTLVRDAAGGKVIHDMSEDGGADYVACRGGRGGWGNRHFATATRQVPMFAKNGTKGEEREVVLELKMLADVGIIGYPSVGKSSLLARISSAKPKIADYHFTTLSPNLGVVRVAGERGFVAADIPGLIEGAAEGAGLGHAFLRHIDRCRLLVHVVDVSGSEGRDPVEDFNAICDELANYSVDLSNRPMIVAANKIDLLPPDSDNLQRLRACVETAGCELYEISAGTTQGTRNLMRVVAEKLRTLPPVTIYEPEYVEQQPEAGDPQELSIEHLGSTWVITGTWLERLVQNINFDDYESRNYFDQMLRKCGLFDRLEKMGIQDGDTVDIYDLQFDYMR